MKSKLTSTLLVFVFMIFSSCTSKKVREEKFENGNPKKKFQIEEKKDGSFLKNGYYKEWFENGQIAVSGYYDNNYETGEWKSYFETGKLEEVGFFKKGQKNGSWKRYSENGQIIKEENYLADQLDGLQIKWYSNGQKECEQEYKRGKANGKLRYWNDEGNLVGDYSFEFGNNISLVGNWRLGKLYESTHSENTISRFTKDGNYKWEYTDSTGKLFSGSDSYRILNCGIYESLSNTCIELGDSTKVTFNIISAENRKIILHPKNDTTQYVMIKIE